MSKFLQDLSEPFRKVYYAFQSIFTGKESPISKVTTDNINVDSQASSLYLLAMCTACLMSKIDTDMLSPEHLLKNM